MVRGYQSCPRFCQTCKQDCRCSSCDKCHSCRIKLIFERVETIFNNTSLITQGSQNREVEIICKTFKHDCLAETPEVEKCCWESLVRLKATSPGNKLNFEKFARSEIITIYLGQEKLPYRVHEQLLCAESIFFKNMLLIGMWESQTRSVVMDLEVDTPLAFEKFMEWCYFGYYIYGTGKDAALLSTDAAVYVFADRIQCMDLKAFALEQAKVLCASPKKADIKSNLSGFLETILFVYEHTMDMTDLENGNKPKRRDGFRELLAKFSASNLNLLRKESSFMDVYSASPEFGTDLLYFVEQSGKGTDTDTRGACILN
ncbi:hypothetical protein TWF730_007514 [Orbilia blumenaviensis]|uniref:BTB domain-containing protein n=1 Tax=Orbilia blumenaviensis TaxID=1796055 RepID=A0AAV9VB85_9PEZI